jgi:lactate racemase
MGLFTLPFGKGSLSFDLPKKNFLQLLNAKPAEPLRDVGKKVAEAVMKPLGTDRLRHLVKKGNRVAVVINDLTRPVPNEEILPVVLEEMSASGVRGEDVFAVIATGSHRRNTEEEIRGMVGPSVFQQLKIYNHDAFDPQMITTIGKTRDDVPISLNTLVARADKKILIGTITPHHGAGYSGGRKSIFPGVSSFETLKRLHDIEPVRPQVGELEGNPLHRNALEAAKVVGVDFIINTIPNGEGRTYQVVAGDMEKSWEEGIRFCDRVCRVQVPQLADIVIASPGGFPRDLDLRQSQKAISISEMMVKKGGTIILAAECSDGIGQKDLYELLKNGGSPAGVIENFRQKEFSASSRKAYMFARAMLHCLVIVVTHGIPPEKMKDMMLTPSPNIVEALDFAFQRSGPDAKVLVLPQADLLIPTFR